MGGEDERRIQLFHALDAGELLSEDALVMPHVAKDDSQQEVVFAGDVVNFDHFRDFTDRLVKPLNRLFFMKRKRDIHERIELTTHLFSIKNGDVLLDNAGLFEVSDSLQDAWSAQSDGLGQIGVGDPSILLKDIKNLNIRLVKLALHDSELSLP